MSAIHPFQLIKNIEMQSIRYALELPQQIQVQRMWSGIGFRLGVWILVANVKEIAGMMKVPKITYVPGVKNWFMGVANVRGSLVPIVDLKGFFLGQKTKVLRDSRILIIQRNEFVVGLLSDEVLGLNHFPEHLRKTELEGVDPRLRKFVNGYFDHKSQDWLQIDLEHLVNNHNFLHVAS